jgi:hypothetical protein
MKRIFFEAVLVLMLACFSVSAFAGEQAKEGNWDFNLAPLYLWMVESILRQLTEVTGGCFLITVISMSAHPVPVLRV